MSLFESIAGQALGALSGQNGSPHAGLLEVVTSLINNPQTGGLAGLVSSFEKSGLGAMAASWVGTGQNLPISAEQIQQVLGHEQVQALAQKLGFSPQELSGQLANLLPQVIDKATPAGVIPQGDGLNSALNLASSLFR